MRIPAFCISENKGTDQLRGNHAADQHLCFCYIDTIIILSFQTDRSGQTVQTQIRLLLEEQSDQGLHCLLFHLHFFDEMASLFEF